jgi:hypothetical protein
MDFVDISNLGLETVEAVDVEKVDVLDAHRQDRWLL